MRLSSRTYVCVPCRHSRRAGMNCGLLNSMRCPQCHGPLWELESKWRIPRKDDDKGWSLLARKVAKDEVLRTRTRSQLGDRQLDKIDAALEAKSNRKNKLPHIENEIKWLKRQREEVLREFSPSDPSPRGPRQEPKARRKKQG